MDEQEVKKRKIGNEQESSWDRIQKLLERLNKNEKGKRSDYITKLTQELSNYYGYHLELTSAFLEQFSPNECVEFMHASEKPRPVVIRVNTLKTKAKELSSTLSLRGMRLEPVKFAPKFALKIVESAVPVGATPEYLSGKYTLQSAASLCPVLALDPQKNERILDMAAAPGGKTSFIAQILENSGTVVANDLKKERHTATVANLHRLGITNVLVRVGDAADYPRVMGGFDRVLLDAPCSGLGVVSRDPTIKTQRTTQDCTKLAQLQKKLLLAAIDSVDTSKAAIIVYSTCSISVEENEAVVQYALDKRKGALKILDAGPFLAHATPGYTRFRSKRFHPSMTLTRRFFPHVHNMDGFFVAKLKLFAS